MYTSSFTLSFLIAALCSLTIDMSFHSSFISLLEPSYLATGLIVIPHFLLEQPRYPKDYSFLFSPLDKLSSPIILSDTKNLYFREVQIASSNTRLDLYSNLSKYLLSLLNVLKVQYYNLPKDQIISFRTRLVFNFRDLKTDQTLDYHFCIRVYYIKDFLAIYPSMLHFMVTAGGKPGFDKNSSVVTISIWHKLVKITIYLS